MSDVSDLQGIYPTRVGWGAETGILFCLTFDASIGERAPVEISLGSPEAKFVLDLLTRERGYTRIRRGSYEERMSPVGAPVPAWEEGFKPTFRIWALNPSFGEVRIEASSTTFRDPLVGIVAHCLTYKEAAQGLQPVIVFADRAERKYAGFEETFYAPVLGGPLGWLDRAKLPFASRPPTVLPPAALPGLEDMRAPPRTPTPQRRQSRGPEVVPTPKAAVKDELDDEIPSFDDEPAEVLDPAALDAAFAKISAVGLKWCGPKWLSENGITVETAKALVASGRLVSHPIREGSVGLPALLATEDGDDDPVAPTSPKEPPGGERGKKLRTKYKRNKPDIADGDTPSS